MKLWLYYALHTAINYIKRLFSKNMLILILILLAVFGIIGGGVGVVTGFLDTASEETVEETMAVESNKATDEADTKTDTDEDELTSEDLRQMRATVAFVLFFLTYILLALNIGSGEKNGSDIFTMGDVNFLFPAPLRPQTVLLFRLSFTMLGVVAGTFYGIFWVTSSVRHFHLGIAGYVLPGLGLILLLMIMKVFQVCSYTFFSAHKNQKKLIRPCLTGGFVIFVVIAVIFWLRQGGMNTLVFDSLEKFAENPVLGAIPFCGWSMAFVWHLLGGHIAVALGLLLLNVAGAGGLLWLCWHTEVDFYEDALGGASHREAETAAAAEGSVLLDEDAQEKRAKQLEEAEKQGKTVVRGQGAEVFFYKNMLADIRLSALGFLSKALSVSLIISILVPGIANLVGVGLEIGVVVVILAVIIILCSTVNPVEMELDTNIFVMVPEPAEKKVLAVAAAGIIDHMIYLVLPVLSAAFLCNSGLGETLVSYLFLTALYGFMMMMGIMLDFLLPPGKEEILNSLLGFIMKMITGAVLFGGMVLGWVFCGYIVGAAVAALISLALGVVFFFIGAPMLHEGR